MKSKIIKKLSINFEKEIVADQVYLDKDVIQQQQKQLLEAFKDLPENEKIKKVNDALKQLLLKNTFFSKIMEFIGPYYEFDIDEDEIKDMKNKLKPIYPSRTDEQLNVMAEREIEKELIYDDLQNQFHLKLTQEQIDKALADALKQSPEEIENFKKDEQRYVQFVNFLQNEYITGYLLNRFPLRVNLPYDWSTQEIMLFRLPPGVVPTTRPNPNNAAAPANSSNEKKPA